MKMVRVSLTALLLVLAAGVLWATYPAAQAANCPCGDKCTCPEGQCACTKTECKCPSACEAKCCAGNDTCADGKAACAEGNACGDGAKKGCDKRKTQCGEPAAEGAGSPCGKRCPSGVKAEGKAA